MDDIVVHLVISEPAKQVIKIETKYLVIDVEALNCTVSGSEKKDMAVL